ncbi:MAG: hypothetical protein N3G20_12000, partial [Verrucomicrobiae bacterium]|nr:hypothetical protein [Verrucomicrobiae bacterium]
LRRYFQFRRCQRTLLRVASIRQPDVVVGVDFSGFNLRFACALRRLLRQAPRFFGNWKPIIVQYVSPQVWASRPGRVRTMQKNLDLVLCLFSFEKEWYLQHAPGLRVEFVGHPVVDRHQQLLKELRERDSRDQPNCETHNVVLLPGSREEEIRRHAPAMLEAARLVSAGVSAANGRRPGFQTQVNFEMVLANAQFKRIVESLRDRLMPQCEVRVGGLGESLAKATVAMACTGTVTLECALYRVPTVTLYKTSPLNYFIARRLVTVRYLAMPNILAGEEVFPEFIQDRATPVNLARAAAAFLESKALRDSVRSKLGGVVAKLGPSGAASRAAAEVSSLLACSLGVAHGEGLGWERDSLGR